MKHLFTVRGNDQAGFRVARYVEPEPDMPGLCKFFGMVEYATYPGGQVRWFSRREDAQKYIAKREKFELVRARKGQAVPA